MHQRGIEPGHIAGFHTWITLGRRVRKGETALKVLAPIKLKDRTEQNAEPAETDKPRVFFKTAFVFDVSQTDQQPGADPIPLDPPSEPLTGDTHAHLLAPLARHAGTLGYTVAFESIPGAVGGWCDPVRKRIVVDADAPPNAQVRTLVHETVHAHGVDYQKYSRPQAEVIVDTTTLVVLSGLGLDTSGETIPYVAGWGENGALEAVTEFAQLIDTLARRVENAISDTNDQPDPAAQATR